MCLADEGMETAYHGQAEYAVSAGGGGGVYGGHMGASAHVFVCGDQMQRRGGSN